MKDKLKAYWNEHPLETIAVVSIATTAVAKLVDSLSAAKGRRAYAKAVNYRVKHRK